MEAEMHICYLCGKPIEEGETASRDHRTPRALLQGAQPKRKGFTFGGFLPTHESCNNHFKGEVNVPTALRLLEILHDDTAILKGHHPDDPSIPILVIDAARFGSFTKRDLTYFKIADFSADPDQTLPAPEAFGSLTKTNAKNSSLQVILSVLAKSAVAHLIGVHGLPVSTKWRILALPFIGARLVDLEALFGEPVRFAPEVRFWVTHAAGNHTVLYQAGDLCIAFVVGHEDPSQQIANLESVLTATEGWLFEGGSLNELVDYRWIRTGVTVADESQPRRNERCKCGSGRRFKHCCGRR